MNIIIVDDEKMAIDVLRIKLTRLTQFQITIKGAFTNAADALAFLEKESVDIVFLDIEMIDMHGLQVAKQLVIKQPSLQIIFVTAHAQFAVDAFEVEATDYLLKPVHEKRLIKALTKAQQRWQVETPIENKENLLYAHTLGSFYLLDAQHEVMKWRTRKVKELFLYLWFHQKRPMLNVVIIEDLWPDLEFDKAASNLHTSIYQLRKLLKENGIKDPIQLVNYHYQLNVDIESDYEELNQILEQENHDETPIQQLLNCYEGDFLAEEEYLWAIQVQLRLKQGAMHVLEMYIENSLSTNSLLKLNCLQKLLELDEFNEKYMFLLLEFLIQQNKKQDCVNCYEHIQEKLAEISVSVPEKIHKIYNEYMAKV
ncbi:response regulator [Lysinibacillus sp. FJAT-14222]|uniref:response regulator n=1 Tax=Lysinibacillus sp. FJAT-14222 TaxID=1932366 RepID=UPI0006AD8903|nr:response regulator [Lysinibacillus sp. FJAT-14222]KOS63958.1 response regulator receiver protein [Lysinibacillus sp. FJAT-14222]